MEIDEVNSKRNWRKPLAIILLILTTLLWGTTFIITKTLTQSVPIFLYLGLRYLIGTIGFIPLFFHFRFLKKKILFVGFITGVIYYLSMVFQTYGLQTTTAGKAGFITGLSTVIVPFITWIFYKKKIKSRVWLAVILSVIGMALLLLEGEAGIIIGDILVHGSKGCDEKGPMRAPYESSVCMKSWTSLAKLFADEWLPGEDTGGL